MATPNAHAAGRFDEAFATAVDAASDAARDGALLDAAGLYQRALDCAKRSTALSRERLADVAYTASGVYELVGRYDDALGALDSVHRVRGPRADVLTRRATVLERTGATASALRLLRRAEHLAPTDADLTDVLLRTASVLSRRGRLRDAYDAAARALRLAESIGDEQRMAQALLRLEMNGSELGVPDAVEHGQRAMEMLRRAGSDRDLAHLLLNLGAQSKATDDWALAAQQYADSEAAYQRAGDTTGRAFAMNNRAEILLDQGRLDEASDEIDEARRIFRAAGHGLGAAATASTIGTIRARQRRHDDARRWLEESTQALDAAGFEILVLDAALRRAENELLADQPDRAAEALESARRLVRTIGDTGGLDLWLDRLDALLDARRGRSGWQERLRRTADAARAAHAAFDTALCLDALQRLGQPTPDEVDECARLAARLGVSAFPPLPDLDPRPLLQSPQ